MTILLLIKLQKSDFQNKVQSFGHFLSGMVMLNIGAFIAWGLITAFFIPTGWLPNEGLASLVGPMITYMLPLLIAFSGGKLVAGIRGGLLAVLAYQIIGPIVVSLNELLSMGVNFFVSRGLLPLASIFIEPAKILFLNNAINHGVLSPLGIQQVEKVGKSIFFMLETNPGPGLGVLLAYWVFAKGDKLEFESAQSKMREQKGSDLHMDQKDSAKKMKASEINKIIIPVMPGWVLVLWEQEDYAKKLRLQI